MRTEHDEFCNNSCSVTFYPYRPLRYIAAISLVTLIIPSATSVYLYTSKQYGSLILAAVIIAGQLFFSFLELVCSQLQITINSHKILMYNRLTRIHMSAEWKDFPFVYCVYDPIKGAHAELLISKHKLDQSGFQKRRNKSVAIHILRGIPVPTSDGTICVRIGKHFDAIRHILNQIVIIS